MSRTEQNDEIQSEQGHLGIPTRLYVGLINGSKKLNGCSDMIETEEAEGGGLFSEREVDLLP